MFQILELSHNTKIQLRTI